MNTVAEIRKALWLSQTRWSETRGALVAPIPRWVDPDDRKVAVRRFIYRCSTGFVVQYRRVYV